MKKITTLLFTLQLGLLAASAQQTNFGWEPVVVWPLAYQGTVTSNGVPLDLPPSRPMDIILRLYDALSGGTQIGATITNSVEVTNGQFTVLLDGWTKTDLAAPALWLEVALGSGSIGDPLVTLSPRQRMTDLPRAAVAETALTIPASALSVTNIGTNGVDGAILAPGSVQGDKIAAGQVVKRAAILVVHTVGRDHLGEHEAGAPAAHAAPERRRGDPRHGRHEQTPVESEAADAQRPTERVRRGLGLAGPGRHGHARSPLRAAAGGASRSRCRAA